MTAAPWLVAYLAGAVPVMVVVFVRTARTVSADWRRTWGPLDVVDSAGVGVLAALTGFVVAAAWPLLAVLGATVHRLDRPART